MAFESILRKQKCDYISPCYKCYIRELHSIKSLFLKKKIISFDKLLMHILNQCTMTIKDN